MKKYSVLTFNIGKYELLHEIPTDCLNPSIEYIYVTDDYNIKSDTWQVVYVDNLSGDNFDKCLQIRYNPFKYVNTDIVMKIDGSMSIHKDVITLFEKFNNEHYDAAVMIHPHRDNIISEYMAWYKLRNYPLDQANKCLDFINNNLKYDLKYKGLYQANFSIQKNDDFNTAWNKTTYDICKHLATEPNTIERVDQIISSIVLNMMFNYKNIMPVSNEITNDGYFNWHIHNTNDSYYIKITGIQYLFNKETFPTS